MTYSRPGTNTVNALGGVGDPMEIAVKGDSRVTVSDSGPLQDNRNPNQLLKNAEARTAAVTSFVNTITKQGPKLYKGILQDQANRQIGELLASTDPEDLFRSTTSNEQRDVVRNLNPFAQEKLDSLNAQYAGNKYQEIYSANLEASRSLLTDPTRSPEERAEAEVGIRTTSREQSGLSLVAPRALAQISGSLQEFEGLQSGLLYKGTLERKREQALDNFGNSLTSEVMKIFSQNSQEVESLKQPIEQIINEKSLMFTPEQQAGALYEALAKTVGVLVQGDQFVQVQDVMRGLRNLQIAGIKTPSGSDFFDAKLPNGKTLGLALTELEARVEQGSLKHQAQQTEEEVGGWATLYAEADSPQARQLIEDRFMAGVQLLPEGQRRAAIVAFGQIKSQFNRPTELQEINAANLRALTLAPGYSKEEARKKWNEAVESDAITAEQYARGSDALTTQGDQTYDFIDTARRASQDDVQIQIDRLLEEGYRDGNKDGTTALQAEDPKEARQRISGLLLGKTQIELERRSKEAAENGNPWTQEMFVNEYRKEIQRQADIIGDRFRNGFATEDEPESARARVEKTFVEFANNIKDKTGDLTVKDFPIAVMRTWQRGNPGKTPTVKDLTKILTKQLEGLKDEEGKPVVPDAKKKVREALNKTNIGDRFNALLEFVVGAPQLNDENDARRMREKQEKDGSKADKKDDQASAGSLFKSTKNFVSNGLGTLANVLFTPSAVAGTLEGKPGVLNSEQLDAFAKVMSKREKLTAKTAPLPQVTAGSPVQRLPIAIANINHPFFIAIGIAEGTRTASGSKTKNYYGHSDRGDGNMNVGTVSGGRNGGSPQQVDREWMGILTQVSVTMAPKLQSLGLRPNTQGWNRLMFNILDLRVQATPKALTSFVRQLPKLIKQNLTIEAIAKARADSYFNPATGRLEASGFGNNYSRLLADQRSRAGVYDYKRRF